MKTAASTHTPIEDSRRVPLPGARAVGPVNPHTTIAVLLKLRRKKALPPLKGRPSKTMTRAALASTYGASAADIAKVTKSFARFGLKATASSEATRTVELSGTAAQLEKAFLVKLFNYSHPEGAYRGRVGVVQVPSALADIVEGVFGLDNRRVARARPQPSARAKAPNPPSNNPADWYRPAELAAHYNYPPGDGSGQTVGLLEFGGGYFPADFQSFGKMAGLKSLPAVKTISVDGTPTNAHDGAEGEVMMDIEVVAGVCPGATIVVYFAQFTEKGWIKAVDAVIQDHTNNPTVVSCSWGNPEDVAIWTKSAMKQIDKTLEEAANLGITVCIAAGDDGSSDADLADGHAHCDFPSASPYVIAVGGTTIPQKGSTQPDIVWFEGDGLRPTQQGQPDGGSTGGGVSVSPRPAWQSAITITSVNPGAIAGRVIPDVAANADWDASPYLLVVDGQPQPNGGTSAATPLFAALIALINAQLPTGKTVGYLTPVLYGKNGSSKTTVGAACFTDVVSGQNATAAVGGYSAGPGYDACSGWGTPNGAALLAALAAII